jgi:serine/threonine-protein kinase
LIQSGTSSTWPPAATAETAAPEVAAGWGTPATSASVLSDVYSLGATGFWLLTGRPPYDLSGAADVMAKMATVAAKVPLKLRDLAPHVPQPVASVIESAMARAPIDRIPSVTNLAAALGRRSSVARKWRRTDEHGRHIACWRGEPQDGGSTYVLCLEQGARPTQSVITTVHAGSGRRVTGGSRTTPARSWGQAVRSVMRALG